MLAYPLALTALLAGSATAVSRTTKQEFIRKMSSQKNLDRKLMADVAKSSRSLTKSIKQNAIVVPPGRKLEDAANANQNQYNQQQNQKQQYYSSNYMSGTDDAFANADWENNWGFDASQYSLSYERCATVKHFDLDKAAQEDSTSPFRTQHFAVLRLCPTMTCDTPDWYLQDDAGAEAEAEAEAEEQEQQEEQAEIYGANGRGCQSNYATFLLDAGEYLEIMADYEDTQFEMYCGYCEHYMQSQYNKWVSNGGHRDLEFEEFKNDPHRMLGNEWNACSVYAKACNGGFQDDYADYLNCAQVQKDNGMVAYTQATCAEDGETITIGLYSDADCSEDITSSSNIANWIGEYVDDEEMAHYYKKVNAGLGELIASYGGQTNVNENSVCMPCAAENQAWFLKNDDAVSNQGEIAEICDNIFLQSARCDKTLSNWWQHKRNPKYADSVALQEVSCSYIDSMKMGKYDISGNVVMDNNRLYNEGEAKGLSGNVYFQEYGQGIAEVSPLQIALLVLSIMACVILALWSTTLHKSLTKGGYKWKPSGRRGVGAGADDIPRQDSGIVVGRSQSNHSSYYMG